MTEPTFVDTGAWIALANARDQWHASAVQCFERLLQDRAALVTSNLVISETYEAIRRVGGSARALRFLDSLESGISVQCVYSTAELESNAVELLRQFSDQAFSYTDAVSFSIMRVLGIQRAFAFDADFIIAGFVLLPTR